MKWLLAVLAALAVVPFLREWLRPRMADGARQSAPGRFANLSRGLTHYRWLGPEDGPVAVCVHGLTTPAYVWTPIAEGLAAKGFRVLVYDLYGRGHSDRPRGLQDADFLVGQLEELLASQEVTGDFTLLGYSMGGAIAASFTARHPDRVRQLVLLAPAGMGHDLGPAARLMAQLGIFGSWLMHLVYARSYRSATDAERTLESRIEGIVDLQQAELRYRGFIPAVLASMRGILDEPMADSHRKVCAAAVPVLAVWGGEDDVIPIAGKATLREWNPDARHAVIEGAGHALAYTHPDEVLSALDAE